MNMYYRYHMEIADRTKEKIYFYEFIDLIKVDEETELMMEDINRKYKKNKFKKVDVNKLLEILKYYAYSHNSNEKTPLGKIPSRVYIKLGEQKEKYI